MMVGLRMIEQGDRANDTRKSHRHTHLPISNEQMTDDQNRGLRYWVEKMNARGYATEFGRGRGDQWIIEASVLSHWVDSIEAEWNIKARNTRLRRDAPPDADAEIDGRSVTVELKEFVDPSLLQRTTHAKKKGGNFSVYAGTGFEQAQWNRDRFQSEVVKRVNDYAGRYSKRNKPKYDYLLLYTGEPWLSPDDVEQWISEPFLETQVQFGAVHLLMSYTPRYRPHWPVFRLM